MLNEKFKNKRKIIVLLIILFMGIVGVRLYKIYAGIEIYNYSNSQEWNEQTIREKNEEDNTISQMLENNTKCVVGISKLKNNGDIIFTQKGVEQIGIGSGVIVSEKGYILTNEHVSGSKNSSCYVTMGEGQEYVANVVWSDSNLDLAIVKINMKCIDYAILGDSDALKVGTSVYAIGNPIGFEFQKTVTSGIVSALDRTIIFNDEQGSIQSNKNGNEIYMSNLIQTDATINPGNSGGPLINNNGEVIGITTVKITSADGIGFAVPINVVKPIINKLENDGKFEEASLGIFAYDKNVIPYLNSGLKFDSGIYVAQISLDSPAINYDLQVGDIITKIDDRALNKMCDLREYIFSKNIGDSVRMIVLRNNKERIVDIKLSRK